jgi:hypothetical protein
MPTLKPYTAPAPQVNPASQRATAADFGAPVGAALSSASRDVQYIKTQMEEDESRQALVGASQVRAKYAQALDQATLTGADVAPIRQAMMDDLAKVGESFATTKGQDALAHHTAQSELMFDEQANHIAVTRAANDARLQGEQFLSSQSAVLRSQPSALPIALGNAETLVDTFKLSPDKRALALQDLKSQLNMAAVVSSARIDPEGTKKRLENGEWDLTPQQREQGVNETETQMRAIRADEIHKRQLADYDLRKADAAASDDITKKILSGIPVGNDIRMNADLTAATRENLSRFQAWYLSENANKPHPANLMNLWLAIHAPSDDARKIYNGDAVFQAAERGDLNPGEAERALTWVANQKDENNIKLMSKLQGKMSTIRAGMTADPQWAAQGELSSAVQMEIVNRATQRMNELRREGPNGKDPSQIFDPNSKEFMFSPGLLTSVANDIRSQHRALTYPKFDNPNDPSLLALPPGTHFLDNNGVERIVPKPAGATPAQQHATSLDVMSGYIEPIPRSGGQFVINAPNRSGAHVLNGKRYPSREAALEALKGL